MGRYVLAFYCGHDANVSIIGEGRITHIERERLTRTKHEGWGGADVEREIVTRAIALAGVHEDEIIAVAGVGCCSDIQTTARSARMAWTDLMHIDTARSSPTGLQRKDIQSFFVPHHLAHAAYAFYTSPFEEAQVIGSDGGGDAYKWPFGEDIVVDTGTGWARHPFGASRAEWTYAYDPGQHIAGEWGKFATELFRNDYAQGQVMALMGVPEERWGELTGLDPSWRPKLLQLQAMTNWSFFSMLRYGAPPRVAMAGGVALNGIASYGLMHDHGVEAVWVPPAPHDGGLSVGAGLYVLHQILGVPRVEYSPETVVFSGHTDSILDEEPPIDQLADMLAAGKVVAVAHGRAESGPRALGHRSILADPRSAAMKDRINQVKGRQGFRPVAPAVLASRGDEYFELLNPVSYNFMTCIANAREKARAEIPAGLHYDGTARVQMVRDDSWFGRLLSAFNDRTGVPILLNTSFNLAGEAIANDRGHAMSTFARSTLDAVAIGGTVVER